MTRKTVSELQSRGVLLVEDGNHGEYRPRPDEFAATGVPFIRAADMSSGVVDFAGAGKINAIARARIRKGIGAPGDVILSHKGTVGRVAVAPLDSPDFVCSPQTTFWRSLDPDVLDQRYLRYVMQSADFIRQLDVLKGQTDMAPYVSLSDQRSMKIGLPGILEQRAIAEVLGALDGKIAANERVAYTARDLLAARFDALGIDLYPSDGSEELAIAEVVELNPRERLPKTDNAVYLEMKNLPESAMTISNWSHRDARGGARFRNGDTLLARITPCLENGKTGFVDFLESDDIGVGSTEFIVMRRVGDIPAVLPYFLAKSSRFREFAIRHMVGSSGRQRLSAGDLRNYVLTRPRQEDVTAFGELSSLLMKRVRSCVDESRALARTRDALLPLLMSGKVRVKDAETAVSEVV